MKTTALLLLTCLSLATYGQETTTYTVDSIDSVYGIQLYAKYNPEFGEPHYPQPAPLTSEFYYLIDRVEKYIDLNYPHGAAPFQQ